MTKRNVMLSVEIEDGEEVIFFAVSVISPDRHSARMKQYLGAKVESDPHWRAGMLRSLADTIALEADLAQE